MGDADGPRVAQRVYEELFREQGGNLDPDVVPYALDDAVRAMRKEGVPAERWALFIHLGM